jgi:hypothetical protein
MPMAASARSMKPQSRSTLTRLASLCSLIASLRLWPVAAARDGAAAPRIGPGICALAAKVI